MEPRSPNRACAHCGLPVRATEDETAPVYCCAGCETVAGLLHEGGWDAFYERREGYSPRPMSHDNRAFDSEAYAARFIRDLGDGTQEMRLRVGGVRCAACVWLNERVLASTPGISDAHVSYGTGVATVKFDATQQSAQGIANVVASLGYTPQEPSAAATTSADELTRLGVAAFCAMNVMFMHVAIYFGDAQGMEQRYGVLFAWGALLLATPAVLYSATTFFTGSIQSLRRGIVSMDVPIAFAIAVMYVHGALATRSGAPAYLDSLVMLITFLLGGRVLVSQGRNRAAAAAEAVLAAAPTMAMVERDGRVFEVAVDTLQPGDMLVVGTGQRLGADAIVRSGTGYADVSHVTGEARPITIGPDEALPAGASIVSGQLRAEVVRAAAQSTVARIETMVRDALESRVPRADHVDRIAPYFTAAVLATAIVAGIAWGVTAGPDAAVRIVVAVLVVACPCALALAAPTTFAVGIGAAARGGAFVRSGEALIALAEVTDAAFDKTGTLTEGRPRVVDANDEALTWAAAVELGSVHPIARAITHELQRRDTPARRASHVTELEGGGVCGTVEGHEIRVAPIAPNVLDVTCDGVSLGTITVRDTLRDDAVTALSRIGVPATVLSGDHPEVVAQVLSEVTAEAAALGYTNVTVHAHGGLRPEDKAAWVLDATATGAKVLFVGDGINDAPALANAHVGVAMGEGAEAALQAADVVVLAPGLAPVAHARAVGGEVTRVLRQNARFALAYNVGAVCLACAGMITPLAAAVLMPLSSLVVIGNALSIPRRVRSTSSRAPALGTAPAPANTRGPSTHGSPLWTSS